MYLALFRLHDGEKGINELEEWLRNVKVHSAWEGWWWERYYLCLQLHAPGCPVIIVGTHLDKMSDLREVKRLKDVARERYEDRRLYPNVSQCVE
jgi:GTP-binding protein EngB required for normal cell division